MQRKKNLLSCHLRGFTAVFENADKINLDSVLGGLNHRVTCVQLTCLITQWITLCQFLFVQSGCAGKRVTRRPQRNHTITRPHNHTQANTSRPFIRTSVYVCEFLKPVFSCLFPLRSFMQTQTIYLDPVMWVCYRACVHRLLCRSVGAFSFFEAAWSPWQWTLLVLMPDMEQFT